MEKEANLPVEDNPDDVDLTLRAIKKNNITYIRKLVDFEQFVEAIKILGLYWTLWNVRPLTLLR